MKKASKEDKEVLKKKFIEFLERNDLTLNKSLYSLGFHINIESVKKNDRKGNINFYVDYLINEKYSIKNINGEKYFYNFIGDLVQKKEDQRLAFWFAKKMEPPVNSSEFGNYAINILHRLSKNKELYFQYIARPNFLNATLENMDNYFKTLDSQEYKESLFELFINSRYFKTLDNQTICYGIYEKYIRNKSKYKDYFSNILILNKNDLENINLIESSDKLEVVSLNFSIKKLNSLNLNKEYNASLIPSLLEGLIGNIDNKFLNELNLEKATFHKKSYIVNEQENQNEKQDTLSISLYGRNLNEKFLKLFFNKLLKDFYAQNKISLYESKVDFIREILLITQKEYLDKTLAPSDKKLNVRKI